MKKNTDRKNVSLWVPVALYDMIGALVDRGFYKNRSDVMLDAIRVHVSGMMKLTDMMKLTGSSGGGANGKCKKVPAKGVRDVREGV
jgi:hypothetical protein